MDLEVGSTLRVLEKNLLTHIKSLSSDIGERNYLNYQNLIKSAEYIQKILKNYNYEIEFQEFSYQGQRFKNIIAEHKSYIQETEIIIGAHYDTVVGSPGADDNASGVASLLELANLLKSKPLKHKVSFVFFANEEPPFFQTSGMGSILFAQKLKKEGRGITGMISLESVGYFSQEIGSQGYPLGLKLFYPSRGNFIAIVGNLPSKRFGKSIIRLMKETKLIPVESLFIPSFLVPEISLSDNYSFWQFGFPAIMITDTAFLRNPNYHQFSDRFDTLNYKMLSLFTYALHFALLFPK